MKVFITMLIFHCFQLAHVQPEAGKGQFNRSLPIHESSLKSSFSQIVDHLQLSNGEKLQIRITLPYNYDPGKKFPVLLGPGLDGGRLEYGCRYFGKDPAQYGWILVESLVHMKGESAMIQLLDYLESHYLVEGFHLLGFSANSVSQFALACSLKKRISSVTGMPGHPKYKDLSDIMALENIKVLMVVGEKDHWWRNSAMDAEARMKKHGISVDLLVVPDGGHILDEFAGRPLFNELEKLRITY